MARWCSRVPLFDWVPEDWRAAIGLASDDLVLAGLDAFLTAERARHEVYPPAADLFAALHITPYTAVHAVIVSA